MFIKFALITHHEESPLYKILIYHKFHKYRAKIVWFLRYNIVFHYLMRKL